MSDSLDYKMTKEEAQKIIDWLQREKPTVADYGNSYKMSDIIMAYKIKQGEI